jgi:hypothetical protein
MGLSRSVMRLLTFTSISQVFPAVCNSGTEGEYRKQNLLRIVKLSAAQGWVVSATFRQIYSQNTSPVAIVQEAIGNVVRGWVKQIFIYVMAGEVY